MTIKRFVAGFIKIACILSALLMIALSPTASALGSQQNPQSGSLGLEATIPSPPPSQAATIAVPGNGQTIANIPIVVSGLCPNGLLIKILDNNVFVGSAVCVNNSYSLKVGLFNGRNDIVAMDYDSLGQSGPASNGVSVTYNGAQAIPTGSRVTITSEYAEKGANPGQVLSWPIIINGGTAPYAISVDWGDGQPSTLQSSASGGQINIKHTYATSGTYSVTIEASDSQGNTGFLQVVGVANGQITANATSPVQPKSNTLNTGNLLSYWWLLGVLFLGMIPSFWLGSKHGKKLLLDKYN
jgi:hypothetical protein